MSHLITRSVLLPAVLLTGFGPFPGMADNVSARLVRAVAQRARAAFPDYRFHAAVLPTEWHAAPERVTALISRLRPSLTLHFGVAKEARGFRIETQGLNTCRIAADATGRHPPAPLLIDGGPEAYAASLPVAEIVERLEALNLPVTTSNDAGGYLCNAVLYHALHAVSAPSPATRAGFIHIPSDFSEPPLTFDAAVAGSLEIIHAALHETRGKRR